MVKKNSKLRKPFVRTILGLASPCNFNCISPFLVEIPSTAKNSLEINSEIFPEITANIDHPIRNPQSGLKIEHPIQFWSGTNKMNVSYYQNAIIRQGHVTFVNFFSVFTII